MKQLPDESITLFLDTLWRAYDAHGRHDLPWRQATDGQFDPYHILVSELMLQQTQVGRVTPKYQQFLRQFPDLETLAAASLGEVLVAWQGLGYNRRAKYLWQAAQAIVGEHGGQFPDTLQGLVALPGVGKNTAGAVLAYAYNQPTIFIETNVRTVYIHHFFNDHAELVHDKDILELLEQTLDRTQPRNFYWALMDYGTHLKQTVGNAGARSKSYVRQAPFAGSRRQVRGRVLRLLATGSLSADDLRGQVADDRFDEVVAALTSEGMVTLDGDVYRLT
jgi:A/G-specific adenine glycosylase